MTDNTDPDDTRDPLRAAFEDYRRAPRDIVPKEPWPIDQNADLDALGDGQPVDLTYVEVDTAVGVTRRSDRITVTRPIYAKDVTSE